MTELEYIEAQCQLETLQKDASIFRGLQSILRGSMAPGARPELVAKAIRENLSIPLKYTQSYPSLSSLYRHAVEQKDTQLIQWTTNQIYQTLGSDVLARVQRELVKSGVVPPPGSTSRKMFISMYREMNITKLQRFKNTLDRRKDAEDTFWSKQIERIINANKKRAELSNQREDELGGIKCLGETLRVCFLNEKEMNLPSQWNVSPYVTIACLIEAHTKRMNWAAILRNNNFSKGVLIKRYNLPKETIIKLLKKAGAGESIIAQIN